VVQRRLGASEQGFFNQLKDDRTVYTAAVAMTLGVGDPVNFLGREGVDWEIECEVIRQARQMQFETRQDEIKANAIAVGNAVAAHIAKMFG
jgi:hypothetical protein